MTAPELLVDARIRKQRLPSLPESVRPQSVSQGYEVQALLLPRLLDHLGGDAIGYKIACTNEIAQRQLHVDGPFFGRLLSATSHASPAQLSASQYFMMVMEAEFAFAMERDLPPRADEYTRAEVGDAIAGVRAGIEVVDSRFESWTTVGTPSLIADNACHAGWIHGPLVREWRAIDLAAQHVRLVINGDVKGEGSGAAVLGHPLNAVTWLANALARFGQGLKAGDSITTGVTTDIYMAGAGDHVIADFGSMGRAELRIVA
jgi:2-keto-4-pentenoate hydratase